MHESNREPRTIAFEGVDGAGKSTVIKLVAERLRARGIAVCLPRAGKEHASRPTRRIRRLTRDRSNLELHPRSEFLLYLAREVQVLEEQVRPALARGETVLLDRSVWTPIVLGSSGRGLDFEDCLRSVDAATGAVRPDLTLIFDVHPRTSRFRKRLEKIATRRWRDGGRKGLAGSEFKVRVRRGYEELADRFGFPVFHAERGTPDEVAQKVVAYLEHGHHSEVPEDRHPCWLVPADLDFAQALGTLPDRARLYFGRRVALERGHRSSLHAIYPRLAAWACDAEDPLLKRVLKEDPEQFLALLDRRNPVLGSPREAMALQYPAAVARSLRGLTGPEADRLRQYLVARAPGAVVESLAGRSDSFSEQIRAQAWKKADSYERAISLLGLDDPLSWKRREAVLAKDPATAVTYMAGLQGPRCDAILERWAPYAPKAVLRALARRSDPAAHALRRTLLETGREVIDTIRGLDDPDSWALRERCVERWPSTVIWSLAGLHDHEKYEGLRCECLESAPEDLFVRRRAYLLDRLRERPSQAGLLTAEDPED